MKFPVCTDGPTRDGVERAGKDVIYAYDGEDWAVLELIDDGPQYTGTAVRFGNCDDEGTMLIDKRLLLGWCVQVAKLLRKQGYTARRVGGHHDDRTLDVYARADAANSQG